MGFVEKTSRRFTIFPILLGIVLATGSYRGHEANQAYPALGGALILLGILLIAGRRYYSSRQEQGTGEDRPSSGAGQEQMEQEGGGKREYFQKKAESFRDFWSDEYNFDYSPASLEQLDRLIDETWDKNYFEGVNVGEENTEKGRVLTGMVTEFGSYFGETLVRNLGGRWQKHEDMGWVVNVDGNLANVFHIVEDCFREPSKLHFTYSRVDEGFE